ncbi:hypothetical protein P171DRAFT_337432, partial [Karstenula rhodostoma CBS 690.94]
KKQWIACFVAYAGPLSALISFIYPQALYNITQDLHIDSTMANISVTAYMVISEFPRSLLGNMADRLDKRQLYIGTCAILV